jgi:alpha-ribazole phosphatase
MTDRDDRPPFATILCLARGPLAPPYEQAAVGRTDAPLDPAAAERDVRAAAAVAAFRPVRVVAADRKRCVATAERIADASGATFAKRRELRDRDFGAFEGRPWPAIVAADPVAAVAFLNAFASAAPPDGEALPAVATRVVRVLLKEAKRHHRQAVAWVADPAPIRCLVAHALGLPLEAVQRLKLDPFGLTIVRLQADASSVALTNAVVDGTPLHETVW